MIRRHPLAVGDDGSVAPAFEASDRLQQQLAFYRDDGQILPQHAMSVFKLAHPEGGDVVIVEVQPKDLPPVRYKGRVHIRVGPRKATANESEERRLVDQPTAGVSYLRHGPLFGRRIRRSRSRRFFKHVSGWTDEDDRVLQQQGWGRKDNAGLSPFVDAHAAWPQGLGCRP